MPEEEKPSEMEILDKAIQESINVSDKYQGEANGLVTKWIVIAEVAGSDGNASLIFRAPKHLRPWDIEGMLTFVGQRGNYRDRAS